MKDHVEIGQLTKYDAFRVDRDQVMDLEIRFKIHTNVSNFEKASPQTIGNCRNVRGLGKSMVIFRLFGKLRYSNERSTKFESLYQEYKYLEEGNGKMVALQISPKIESLYGVGRQATKL